MFTDLSPSEFAQKLYELRHFGVKGMRWGVVNDDSGGSKTSRASVNSGQKVEQKAVVQFYQVHNAASIRMNDVEIPRINSKPQYRNKDFTHDSPLRRKYFKEYNDTFTRAMNEETIKMLGIDSSKTKRLRMDLVGQDIHATWEDVKHALGDANFLAKTDVNGYIISIVVVDNETMHSGHLIDDAIAHFGILGMRWGKRKDEPSGDVSDDKARADEVRSQIKKNGLQSVKNDDIRALVNRMNLEQNYHTAMGKEPSKFSRGMSAVGKVLTIGGTLQQVYSLMTGPLVKAAVGLAVKKK